MQQRDFLKEQIEQAGRALGKIIGQFIELKRTGDVSLSVMNTNAQLKSELDLEVDDMAALDAEALTRYVDQRQLTDDHLELVIDYLYATKCQPYLFTALQLLDIVDERTGNYSFSRAAMNDRIRKLIRTKN